MPTVTPLTRGEFADLFTNALGADRHNGDRVDPTIAWEHYQRDPDRWHTADVNNPTGDVLANFIVADGPWWVSDIDDSAVAGFDGSRNAHSCQITWQSRDSDHLYAIRWG